MPSAERWASSRRTLSIWITLDISCSFLTVVRRSYDEARAFGSATPPVSPPVSPGARPGSEKSRRGLGASRAADAREPVTPVGGASASTEDGREALAAADAHRHEPALAAGALERVHQ